MDQKTLAKRLKAARERVGLSVIDAAKRLGYKSYQTLSSIEKGERKVKASELTSFAREYFCSLVGHYQQRSQSRSASYCPLRVSRPSLEK